MAISHKKGDFKKYSVGGYGSHFAFTDTLVEAKREGLVFAKKELWRGKWNVLYITVPINQQDAPGSMFYKPTGWKMYVPVRGSGKSAQYILDTIKSREKVAPMKWVKKK